MVQRPFLQLVIICKIYIIIKCTVKYSSIDFSNFIPIIIYSPFSFLTFIYIYEDAELTNTHSILHARGLALGK